MWRDLRVAPEACFLVCFQRHPHDDVDRMTPFSKELAHVEDTGEVGRKTRFLQEFAACARWYRLARLEPASRQYPVRVPVRFLVANQEQCSLSLHHHRDPHPEVHAKSCAILAHAASIPARRHSAIQSGCCRVLAQIANREPTFNPGLYT